MLDELNVFGSSDSLDLKELLDFLDKISYETNLGKNLRNTLRKFDRELLIDEIRNIIRHYCRSNLVSINYKYRIKSIQSAIMKYDKYYPDKQVSSCFNDVLGFRIFINNWSDLDYLDFSKYNIRCVDLRSGKKVDDGYRAIHLYYQKSNYHYPIEIQIWKSSDKDFNNWLHKYSYKYLNTNIGLILRKLYDKGLIKTEEDFIKYINEIKRRL